MKIRQYRPAFFEGFEAETAEFETIDELKSIPFVERFVSKKNHYRLSLTDDNMLMAEEDNGNQKWVVGTITEGKPDLPTWRYKG